MSERGELRELGKGVDGLQSGGMGGATRMIAVHKAPRDRHSPERQPSLRVEKNNPLCREQPTALLGIGSFDKNQFLNRAV